jgi:hypothetical protein
MTDDNSALSLWNADSHFLGIPGQGTAVQPAESASFSNGNPLAPFNSETFGFGLGTSMSGTTAIWARYQQPSFDFAYFVVPTGSTISIGKLQVVVNRPDGSMHGYQISSTPSPFVINAGWSAPVGGSWNDPLNWQSGG